MSDAPASVACVTEIVRIAIGPRRGMRRATPARAWYERGFALEARDPEGAMVAYRRAIAGLPSLADAHNNLGRLHHERGELEAAEACYRRALAIAPDLALYAFNLGVVLEDRGSTAEAIAFYEQALAQDPSFADAHYNLARQLERGARATADDVSLRRAVRHLTSYRQLVRRHDPIFK
jgi:tetratricopeptide (TPR) repeat protein